jgi:hypothetical protein
MDLIDRYVYAVTHNLPASSRPDIEKELRSLIEDMLQQRTGGRPADRGDIEAVLLELGHPRKLADNYRGTTRYLIGPAFFEIYWLVLRIVLIAVTVGMTIGFAVQAVTAQPGQVLSLAGIFLSELFSNLMSVFGIVTLIFALNEFFNHTGAAQLQIKLEQWKPADLPQVPVSSLRIKRGDSIAALVFTVIFLLIINIDISLIGAYIRSFQGNLTIVPLFSDTFRQFIPWLNMSLGIVVVLECIKLALGHWNWPLVFVSALQKVFGLAIGVRLFANPDILNDSYFSRLNNLFQNGWPLPADLPGDICRAATIVIIIAFIIDLLTLGAKGVRLAIGRNKK